MHVKGPAEITVLDGGDDAILDVLRRRYVPEGMMVHVRDDGQATSLQAYPFFAGKTCGDGTTVYVCRNSVCSPPLADASDVEAAL